MTRKPIGITVPYRKTKELFTQDEIIEMANKAYGIDDGKPLHPSALFHLEIFAKLAAAKALEKNK